MKNELNDKEQEVVGRIKQAGPSGLSITQLAADCFKKYGALHPSKANSWVRNSLRWPVALGMVHKTARGRYAKGPGSGAIAATPRPTRKQRASEPSPRTARPARAPKLVLRDIGPFASADVELGALTVLAGPEVAPKSLLLQWLKMAVDAPQAIHALKEAGCSLDSENVLLDLVFGEGTHEAWRAGRTAVSFNGKDVSPASWLKLRARKDAPPGRVSFIPDQRGMLLAPGWPVRFGRLDMDTPVAARLFSQFLHDHLGAHESLALFPADTAISEQARLLIDREVFLGGTVEQEKQGCGSRLRLVFDKEARLPFMAWSPGQREFTPLLLGLHHLLPKGKLVKLEHVDYVIIDEPDLGLTDGAVLAFMLIVFDLLSRGYRVVLSTHSHLVLEVLAAIRNLAGSKGSSKRLAGAFGAEQPEALHKLMQHALEASCRVYQFDRDDKTGRLTTRDLSDQPTQWAAPRSPFSALLAEPRA